ncbi:hypothetical protein OPIT5_29910 [Opitutaceae bacterium TAV5]|nr:hypothetical protein OPIT5_29910 [Opitutaceae bacterium TAV5]
MTKVKNVEKRIWDIEGFDVVIKQNGKNKRSDASGLPHYIKYEKMAKNDMTVSEWKKARFSPTFPGYTVDVIDGNGKKVTGNTKLGTVRDTYSEE